MAATVRGAIEVPRWLPARAQIVMSEPKHGSITGEARLEAQTLARLMWVPEPGKARKMRLIHADQLDGEGRRHGFEAEYDDGRTAWCAQWVRGKMHGLAIQLDRRGRPMIASRFVRGRGTDLWMGCGQGPVSEVREMLDGQLHGLVRWGEPEEPWEEERYRHGKRHGIFRKWSDGALEKDSPQFYVQDRQVSRRAYQAAQRRDASLPRHDASDDDPRRPALAVVRNAIARAERIREDRALRRQIRQLGAVWRELPRG
jgi:hypothetical protein